MVTFHATYPKTKLHMNPYKQTISWLPYSACAPFYARELEEIIREKAESSRGFDADACCGGFPGRAVSVYLGGRMVQGKPKQGVLRSPKWGSWGSWGSRNRVLCGSNMTKQRENEMLMLMLVCPGCLTMFDTHLQGVDWCFLVGCRFPGVGEIPLHGVSGFYCYLDWTFVFFFWNEHVISLYLLNGCTHGCVLKWTLPLKSSFSMDM